jgi:hypothetical protein
MTIKKTFTIFSLLALFFTIFALPFFAFHANAVSTVKDTSGSGGVHLTAQIENPLGAGKTLTMVVADLLKLAAQIGAIFCVFFIIYSGFLFIKAQGDSAELKTAKSIFFWSVIGTAVLLGATVIADLITGTVESVIGK